MSNINRLVEEGKLLVAALALAKNEHKYRGTSILNNVKSLEEAKKLLQNDMAQKTNC